MNRFEELEMVLEKERTKVRERKSHGKRASAKSLRRARALAALGYDVPGTVPALRQPKSKACWATAATILKSWRDNMSLSVEDTMASFGPKWVKMYEDDTGLFPKDEEDFLAASGLVAMRGFNPSIEGWESLLREFGPLWVAADEAPGPAWSMHARVITGIHGDGTAAGTVLSIVDPGGGRSYKETIAAFYPKFEEEVGRTGFMRYQIVHWPRGARGGSGVSAAAKAFGGKPSEAPVVASGPEPWSKFFHFDAGDEYDVDGPGGYNGKGKVVKRTADVLTFTLDMPAYTVPIFGDEIPKAHVTLELTYKKEGAGNQVRVTVDGTTYDDTNAKIVSKGSLRTIYPSRTIPGFNLQWMSFEPDGKNEIDLDIKLDGRAHDFDLERTKRAGAKSLALGDPTKAWSRYFQFAAGTELEVDGPLGYDGTGRVLERDDKLLKFELNMPGVSIIGKKIPKTDLVIEVAYEKEGPGNLLKVTVNGQVTEDDNATIRTDEWQERRTVSPSKTISGITLDQFTLSSSRKNRVLLEARLEGSNREFELRKLLGSAAKALALGGWVAGHRGSSALSAEPWSKYFHFPAGTKFKVDGPLTFDGTGEVIENAGDRLVFRVVVAPFGDARFEVVYKGEGAGNLVRAVVDGVSYEDKNATIHSDQKKSRRTIKPRIALPDRTLQEISVAPDGKDEIDLDVTVDGRSYDFDLER